MKKAIVVAQLGRVVASDIRNLWFESCHRKNFIYQSTNENRKDQNNEKVAVNGPSFFTSIFFLPPYAATGFELTVELHQNGTFEGRSTD